MLTSRFLLYKYSQSTLNEAKNGVLFVDEAYQLISGDQDSFGKEAMEELMKAMNPNEAVGSPIVILAGCGQTYSH